MKRASAVIMLIVFSVAILLPLSLNTPTVSAQDSYSIQQVNHEVEVLYSGHVAIRDTIQVSGQLTGDFLLGFPYKYSSYVLKGIAYDEDNNVFPLSLGVELADRTGFYGAKISFPEAAPQVFTVVFLLSNGVLSQESAGTVFDLDFPAYPTFTKNVAQCNVELVLPATPTFITVTKDDGEVQSTTFSKSNLPAFSYSDASVTFSIPRGTLRILTINELNRQITISPTGDIIAFDSYHITNLSPTAVSAISLGLPPEASNIEAKDGFERTLTTRTLSSTATTRIINVTLTSLISQGQSTTITAEYSLPSTSSVAPFTLNITLFPDFDYYVDTAKVTFIPPEGSRFLSPQLSAIDSSTSLSRDTFQETLSISREAISKIDSAFTSNSVQVTYDYSPLWLSFRPTVWMWTIAIVGCVVVVVWKKTRAAPSTQIATTQATLRLSPENVRAFTEAYDEKTRLNQELNSLETRAQKGKIPRRRYKIQRRTIEVRLDNIAKNITELKKTFRSAGGNYANLVKQLDVAEAELVEVETKTRNIDVRHRKGALPLDSYKKAQADYQRRKEKAEATINGILLRLREETR